jgi:hypothetical protein
MAKDDYEGHTDFFKLDKNGSDTDSSFDFDDLNCSKRRQQFRNDLIIYYSCEGLGAPNNLLSLMWY